MFLVVDTLLTKIEAGELETRLQKYVDTRLNSYESIIEFEKEKRDIFTQFSDVDKHFSLMRKKFENLDTELSQIKGNLNNRATVKAVNDISQELKRMATKEDYQQARDKIERFDDDLSKFKHQNETHAKILRGYDEVLSQKASKINLLDLEEKTHIQLKRIDVVGVIEAKMDNLEEVLGSLKAETEEHFDTINKTISVEILGAVKKAVKQ